MKNHCNLLSNLFIYSDVRVFRVCCLKEENCFRLIELNKHIADRGISIGIHIFRTIDDICVRQFDLFN